jgi:hypothetical protein
LAAQNRLRIFVLIDALGWKFLGARDFLSDLLTHRQPLRTVLGFSSGAIPTLLTGTLPMQNGHWNLYYYDPKGSPFGWLRHFRFLPDSLLNHRVTRRLLAEAGRRVMGLGKNFGCYVAPTLLPYFNWVERRNIYEEKGIAGAPSIFDQLAEHGIPYRSYSYHHLTDEQILTRSLDDLKQHAAGFYFIYLCEMDQLLHDQWEHPERLEQQLGWYAGRLRQIFAEALSQDADARIAIFSDHGMTPVSHHFDLVAGVRNLGFKMPSDYLSVYDSTMARFWFFTDSARHGVEDYLGSLNCGRLLGDDELQQLGILFPDRRYGQLIFLMNPGWLMASSNFNGAGWVPAGMHGYHPDDPYSDGVFLTNRPYPFEIRQLADVYRCMHEALE